MKVKELIEKLKKYDQEAIVDMESYHTDADEGEYWSSSDINKIEVTGNGKLVTLCTD